MTQRIGSVEERPHGFCYLWTSLEEANQRLDLCVVFGLSIYA